MEGITNETVNKEQSAQNFENRKYDPLEDSGNILFDNSSDPDLYFYVKFRFRFYFVTYHFLKASELPHGTANAIENLGGKLIGHN